MPCLYSVCLLIVSLSASAQDSLYTRLVPRHAFKISPFHLFNFYPTIQVGYEMKIAGYYTMQLEGGYVLDYPVNTNPDYQNKRGVKAKLELHRYMLPSGRAKLIFYGALELYWNAVDFDRNTTETECFDPECNHMFTRSYTYTVNYREPGFGLKFGFVKYFSDFFMDIDSGWGVRFISYTQPENTRFISDNTGWELAFTPDENDRTALTPLLGIRFGYRFR